MLNRKGETYVWVCIYIIIFAMIFSLIITYASAVSLIRLQKENTKIVLNGFVASNSVLIYRNIKQGNNLTDGVDVEKFRTMLIEYCTLEYIDGKLYSQDTEGYEKYSMTVPEIKYIETGKLELQLTYTMSVPVKFAGATVSRINVPVTVTSELNKKI